MFRDRADAAGRLARALAAYRGRRPLVLGIPRGGVPMGRIVADALGGDLDVVLVQKIGAPENPEFAVGAVGEDGTVELRGAGRVRERWLQAEVERLVAALAERRRRYAPVRPPLDPAGRSVIVVDDGAATGATLAAALRLVRRRRPGRLVVALAVAPADTVERLEEIADEVVCLRTPRFFFAVGQYFRDFGPVSDEAVIRALRGGVAGQAAPALATGKDPDEQSRG